MPSSDSPVRRYLETATLDNLRSSSSYLKKFVASAPFEIGSALTTLGALATMSIALQFRMENWETGGKHDASQHIQVAELIFALVYAVEVALRLMALGRRFTQNGLNTLDLVLATFGLIEQIVFWFLEAVIANPIFLRFFRYIRLMKLARVSRALNKSKDVRVMLHMVRFSLRSFLFSAFAIALITFICTLMVMAGVEEILLGHGMDRNNPVAMSLVQQWGSIALSMESLFMAVTGGIQWKELADPLRQTSIPWLLFLIVYITFFLFVVVNVIIAMTVHNVFEATNNLQEMLVNIRMENRANTLADLKNIFRKDVIEWPDFCAAFESEALTNIVHTHFELTMTEMEQYVYRICACGQEPIELDTLVTGAIQLKSYARRVDLMEMEKGTQAFMKELQFHQAGNVISDSLSDFSLESLDGKRAFSTEPVDATSLPQRLDEIIQAMPFEDEEKNDLSETAAAVFRVALNASGGCGFLVTSKAAYLSMQHRNIDFQVTDRSGVYPHGYMSERLKGVHVNDAEFSKAVQDFSVHTDSDKWDAGPGIGLSKDGYILMGLHGEAFKAAVRLAGMPTPPFCWDGVGTRHLAAMAACWSLRHHAAVVIVRSDSGTIHTLVHQQGDIVAFTSKAAPVGSTFGLTVSWQM